MKITSPNATANLTFGVIGIIIILISSRFNDSINSSNSDNNITNPIYSNDVRLSGMSLLVASLPLLLDVSINTFIQNIYPNRNELYGRVYYAMATLIFGLHLVLQYNIFCFPTYEISVMTLFWCYRVVVTSTIMFFIASSDPTGKSRNQTNYLTILFTSVACFQMIKSDSIGSGLANNSNTAYLVFFLIFAIVQNHYVWKHNLPYGHFLYLNILPIAFLLEYISYHICEKYATSKVYEHFPLISVYSFVIIAAFFTAIPKYGLE